MYLTVAAGITTKCLSLVIPECVLLSSLIEGVWQSINQLQGGVPTPLVAVFDQQTQKRSYQEELRDAQLHKTVLVS